MIQLITSDNKIIYELEKSELFPDYRSVLMEAISYHIDLAGLLVESENIDDIVWKGINMSSITIRNCSMKRNEFIECFGKGLCFDSCDLTSLKIKKSNLNELHISNSNLSQLSFRNSCSCNSFIIGCDCRNSSFYESDIRQTGFHTSNISGTIFKNCCLDKAIFVHDKPSKEWIKNTIFVDCSMAECGMNYVDDISLLYFWDTNLYDIQFRNKERFTEIINKQSKVIYAIDSDVVWWKTYSWNNEEKRLFRGSLKEFREEVENGFPTTDLYPDMDDYEIEAELLKVIRYLEQWNPE